MNNIIVQNFNHLVKYDDDVYVLGDLMLGGADNAASGLELISALNGKLHLVRGNHDTDKRWTAYQNLHNVVEVNNAIYLDYKKYHFYLSHYPTITSNNDYDKSLHQRLLNLCGHTHATNRWQDIDKGYIYHCEVDAHNCFPVLLDNIIEEIKQEIVECKKFLDCDKCVWQYNKCSGPINTKCPNGMTFKRDPPDGGYYG